MKIAQIAPLVERVPPKKYGGTERVIGVLTDELVRRGHQVTLFASGDSPTEAELVAGHPTSLREAGINDAFARNGITLKHIGEAYARASEFDIIHDHIGVFSLPTAQICQTPVVMTLHGAFFDHNTAIFEAMDNIHYVSISQSQEEPVPALNSAGTIYHGLPMRQYPFSDTSEGYLLNVGRITPIKGTHHAVEIARALDMRLIIAAKLEEKDRAYFAEKVEPYLSDKIQWVGEVDEAERNRLMSNALCFLHPAPWKEPFGLTLIESMACGAPVLALNRGSIPEIVKDGVTGYVCETVADMQEKIAEVGKLDRKTCREYVLDRFSVERMADEYEQLYHLLSLQKKHLPPETVSVDAHITRPSRPQVRSWEYPFRAHVLYR